MVIGLYIIVVIVAAIILFMRHPKFGRKPKGKRLERIRKSANYKNGAFQNISHTPGLTEGVSYYKVIKEFFFEKKERTIPMDVIPSVKTDLLNLDVKQDVLVWFGHSSYFIQLDGKRILVDPVLSGHASPFSFVTKAFKGSDIYSVDDIPEIDYLFITHDHWDHLDYKTIIKLKLKIKKIICGLGTGEHLERWGFHPDSIIEKDWNETVELDSGFSIHIVSARHFSGRGFIRNKALWLSFVLQTPSMKLFLGGDSGYDSHFAEIGRKFGPFDLAIIENGQYDLKWKYIHLLPEEVLKAAGDLQAKKLFPVHSSKFVLGSHAWDEPLIKIMENNSDKGIPIITPMIGELVNLKEKDQTFTQWWKNIG